MNYKESDKILEEIKKAKKILINCHRNPDPDSVGSALAVRNVLLQMGKEVEVVSPDELPPSLKFLKGYDSIKKVDLTKFDFSTFDLFIILDTSTLERIIGTKSETNIPIPVISIDNHPNNKLPAKINLIDLETSSVCEMLYSVFSDWNVDTDGDTATMLLTGIVGDTGSFQFEVYKNTFAVANELLKKGGELKRVINGIFRSNSFAMFEAWGEFLKRFKLDKEHGFIWVALNYEDFSKYKHLYDIKGEVATLFSPIVEDTDFGMVMVEDEPGLLKISLRSRAEFDVSEIASALGGGGHKGAAAARVSGLDFQEAVDKVLQVAKEYAKKS